MFAKQTVASFEDVAAPVVAINKIALDYAEKLVEMNLAGLRKQADVALTGWREALEVKDPGHMSDYLARQGTVARTLIEGYVDEAKAYAKLNQEAANDMRKVVEVSIAKVTTKAA